MNNVTNPLTNMGRAFPHKNRWRETMAIANKDAVSRKLPQIVSTEILHQTTSLFLLLSWLKHIKNKNSSKIK